MAITRILVGIDGSNASARALEWAIELAQPLDAEIVAVHTVGLLAVLPGDRVVPAATHRDELERAVADEWCGTLRDAGVSYRTRLVDGAPTITLPEIADEEDVDLIVVGARGRGGAPARALGSTSQRVVRESTRPVVVIPTKTSDG